MKKIIILICMFLLSIFVVSAYDCFYPNAYKWQFRCDNDQSIRVCDPDSEYLDGWEPYVACDLCSTYEVADHPFDLCELEALPYCFRCGMNGNVDIEPLGRPCPLGWSADEITVTDCVPTVECWKCTDDDGSFMKQTYDSWDMDCPIGWVDYELDSEDCGLNYCGDGDCKWGESKITCPEDCGELPYDFPVCCEISSNVFDWTDIEDCNLQVGSSHCEDNELCLLPVGEPCTLVDNVVGIDDSQQNSLCKTGWCKDTFGSGGVCSEPPVGREGSSFCAGKYNLLDRGADFVNNFLDDAQTALIYIVLIVIGFLIFRTGGITLLTNPIVLFIFALIALFIYLQSRFGFSFF